MFGILLNSLPGSSSYKYHESYGRWITNTFCKMYRVSSAALYRWARARVCATCSTRYTARAKSSRRLRNSQAAAFKHAFSIYAAHNSRDRSAFALLRLLTIALIHRLQLRAATIHCIEISNLMSGIWCLEVVVVVASSDESIITGICITHPHNWSKAVIRAPNWLGSVELILALWSRLKTTSNAEKPSNER